MTDTTTLRAKIQDQIDSVERGLGWLRDGTISTERILVALREMLAKKLP